MGTISKSHYAGKNLLFQFIYNTNFLLNVILDLNVTKVEVYYFILPASKVSYIRKITRDDS